MRKLLLEKIEEIKEELQKVTIEKINLGMMTAHYEKINAFKKKYDSDKLSIKKTLKTIIYNTLEFIFVGVFLMSILEVIPLILKFCLGALACLEVALFAILISEVKKIYKEKEFLVDNGYDPEDEIKMNNVEKKLNELYDDYRINDAYIDDLMKAEEDFNSFINSNDITGLEEYPELLKEYLNKEFNEYLNDPKTMDPKNIDFEPNVLEEDLVWSNPHQLKLK